MARKSMTEVEDQGSNKITEPGEYHVKINKIESKVSSNKGTPFVLLTMEDQETQGLIWDRLFLTENSLGFTKRYLSACGYDMDDLDYEVSTKGKTKGHVTAFYLSDEDGQEEEWDLEGLLDEEEVIVTVKKQKDTYKDPATGETKVRDNPGVEVSEVSPVE